MTDASYAGSPSAWMRSTASGVASTSATSGRNGAARVAPAGAGRQTTHGTCYWSRRLSTKQRSGRLWTSSARSTDLRGSYGRWLRRPVQGDPGAPSAHPGHGDAPPHGARRRRCPEKGPRRVAPPGASSGTSGVGFCTCNTCGNGSIRLQHQCYLKRLRTHRNAGFLAAARGARQA